MKTLSYINLHQLRSHKLSGFGFSLVFPVLGSALIWLNLDRFPLSVPLWFYQPWGENILAPPSQLWLIPLLTTAIIAINFFVSAFLLKRNMLITQISVWATTFVSFVFFISLIEIILVST